MCELLAMSSSQPARLSISLQVLASRGGSAASTRDGWGAAYYQGLDVALFREPTTAADSALAHYLETQGPMTSTAISHIRHATRGAVTLANTQPFVRELAGRMHVFAHNGDLPGIANDAALSLGAYRPVGQTDSEHAFCALLSRLGPLWAAASPPSLESRLVLVDAFARVLRALGPANFLYADGDALFVHAHRRIQPATGRIEPPGLWSLQRHCPTPGRIGGDTTAQAEQAVTLIASVPLTDEAWQPLAEGELMVLRDGKVMARKISTAHLVLSCNADAPLGFSIQ